MEQFRNICKNPWCKAPFFYTEKDMLPIKNENMRGNKIDYSLHESEKESPKECPKCKSFNTELSGGVEWKDKTYEGPRFDGMPHQIKYKVTNYR